MHKKINTFQGKLLKLSKKAKNRLPFYCDSGKLMMKGSKIFDPILTDDKKLRHKNIKRKRKQ